MRGRPPKDENDSADRIEMCLHCPYDPEFCCGEKKCKAMNKQNLKNIKAVARYASKKGFSIQQIAETLGVSQASVSVYLRKDRL